MPATPTGFWNAGVSTKEEVNEANMNRTLVQYDPLAANLHAATFEGILSGVRDKMTLFRANGTINEDLLQKLGIAGPSSVFSGAANGKLILWRYEEGAPNLVKATAGVFPGVDSDDSFGRLLTVNGTSSGYIEYKDGTSNPSLPNFVAAYDILFSHLDHSANILANAAGVRSFFGLFDSPGADDFPTATDVCVGFKAELGGASFDCVSGDGVALQSTNIPATAAGAGGFIQGHLFQFWYHESAETVYFFYDGVLVATHTTRVPNATGSGQIYVVLSSDGGGAGGVATLNPAMTAVSWHAPL